MSLPELKRAIAKLPRRSRRQLAAHLHTLDRRPVPAPSRKITSRGLRSSGSLAAACVAANKDAALARDVEVWQSFDDSPAQS